MAGGYWLYSNNEVSTMYFSRFNRISRGYQSISGAQVIFFGLCFVIIGLVICLYKRK